MILVAHFPNYRSLRAPQITDLFGAVARVLSDYGRPDPHNKLPENRPSREWWGVKESQPSAARIAATAKLPDAPAAPKGGKKAGANKATNVVATIFRGAKRILLLENGDEESDGFFSVPMVPSGAWSIGPDPLKKNLG